MGIFHHTCVASCGPKFLFRLRSFQNNTKTNPKETVIHPGYPQTKMHLCLLLQKDKRLLLKSSIFFHPSFFKCAFLCSLEVELTKYKSCYPFSQIHPRRPAALCARRGVNFHRKYDDGQGEMRFQACEGGALPIFCYVQSDAENRGQKSAGAEFIFRDRKMKSRRRGERAAFTLSRRRAR
jgi:hypothetical protein